MKMTEWYTTTFTTGNAASFGTYKTLVCFLYRQVKTITTCFACVILERSLKVLIAINSSDSFGGIIWSRLWFLLEGLCLRQEAESTMKSFAPVTMCASRTFFCGHRTSFLCPGVSPRLSGGQSRASLFRDVWERLNVSPHWRMLPGISKLYHWSQSGYWFQCVLLCMGRMYFSAESLLGLQ